MTENTEKDVPAFTVEDAHSPVDLTLADEEESEKKERGIKKFDKLKLTEEEIEERRRSAKYMERRRMKKNVVCPGGSAKVHPPTIPFVSSTNV
uniref:Uncharacterized protein n=1 Tax=Magallana gigas TaxID=29159 RepID=K1QS89_MAGGI